MQTMNPDVPQTLAARFGALDQLTRKLVVRRLDSLRRGEITVSDASGVQSFGESADLQAQIQVHHPRFFRHAVLGGTLSVAESYLRGDWDCDDLTAMFRIFIRNERNASQFDGPLTQLARWGHRVIHRWRSNTRSGSQKNISAHYDLGNEFYRLWLDDTLAYSSGIFPQAGATLRQASLEKFDRVCRKLDLSPQDEVLEIGTGWGGFALHAVQNYGCRITTTTISKEQHAVAQKRFAEEGLTDSIRLLQQDYRDLHGEFDKLVSIEMIEAVGHEHLDDYFRQCGGLLKSNGSFVLQAIVMPERGYGDYLKSVDFIQRYVFPGGCLPSLGSILESVGRTTDLRFVHAEDFAPHYAETLRRWRSTFFERLAEVREQGFDDYFIRLWNYYLCYCEAAFEERAVGVLQVQFDKPDCRRDPIEIGRKGSRRAEFQTDRHASHLVATE